MSTDPQTLLDQAKCYLCLGISISEALQLALLAEIAANGGGGGGGGTDQIYSSVAPNPNVAGIVPANQTKGALFYQDPSITLYNEWKWSIANKTWIQTIAP